MKLESFQVDNFQSVLNSGSIKVEDTTCLVGKNEAGKTAILKALYKLNPIREEDAKFNHIDDYPRMDVGDYEDDIESGKKKHVQVIKAYFKLDQSEIEEVEKVFGNNFLKSKTCSLAKGYDNQSRYGLSVNEEEAVKFLCGQLPENLQKKACSAKTPKELLNFVESDTNAAEITALLKRIGDQSFSHYAWNHILDKHVPQFLYFDEYYQMQGCENIQQLKARQSNNTLKPSDQPLLGLIDLARLNLDQITNPKRTQDLKNKLEGASDILYIQAMSSLLEREEREGLSPKWTLTPTGGASKVSTMVRLLVGQKGMNLATLIDIQKRDQRIIEDIYKNKILQKSNVITFADFTKKNESDIEDMFDITFYIQIVNEEYKKSLKKPISASALRSKSPRIIVRLENYFEKNPLSQGQFSHYRPARYFHEKLESLANKISNNTKKRFEEAFSALNKLI